MTQGYIAPGTKRVDSLGAYVMTYYSGAWDYTYSAPCLHLNPPMLEYWLRKANDERLLALGGVLWATNTSKES
jgi:hypothetical protein